MSFEAVHGLPLFIGAALLLNITPGPDMLFVAGTAAARGRRAGVMAALGVGLGCGLHIVLAALGVSALIAASPLAFTLLKWLGAGYLVWIGLSMLLRRGGAAAAPAPVDDERAVQRSVFWQGALTNAINPKVALFFLAFLPQFIVPDSAHTGAAFVLLGLLFDLGGTAVNIAVALAAHGLRQRWAGKGPAARFGPWLQRGVGAVFVGLGVKLAVSR